MTKTTITINGRTYDAITGMPVAGTAKTAGQHTGHHETPTHPAHKPLRAFSDFGPSTTVKELHKPERPAVAADLTPMQVRAEVHRTGHPADQIHRTTEKSHTLYRKALKRPPAAETADVPAATSTRSPLISRFAAEQTVAPEPVQTIKAESAPEQASLHPSVAKALHAQAIQRAEAAKTQPTGKALKEQLIKERLAEVGNNPAKKEKTRWLSSKPRLVTILSSTLALLILGGYLTYITLPSISLRVAASRAGVNATMPEYKPDGYSLDGPIAYSPGEVIISYKSNTNDSGYKLTQKSTNWDTQAVLDNYVSKLTDNYLTFQERGITVYTFGNKAAWVNGGLLYTLDGNAALSSAQILHVATSM